MLDVPAHLPLHTGATSDSAYVEYIPSPQYERLNWAAERMPRWVVLELARGLRAKTDDELTLQIMPAMLMVEGRADLGVIELSDTASPFEAGQAAASLFREKLRRAGGNIRKAVRFWCGSPIAKHHDRKVQKALRMLSHPKNTDFLETFHAGYRK